MTKKGKKKPKIVGDDSNLEMAEIVPVKRVEIIYEDTKAITRAEPDFKWGYMFHMLKEKKVPEARLEDLALYEIVLWYGITKVATRPEILLCAEVIGWILPRIDTTEMIINDEENTGVASFAPAFIPAAYNLPEKETNMTT